MSHHGMQIPPSLMPLMPGMMPLEKANKANQKRGVNKREFHAVDDLKEDKDEEEETAQVAGRPSAGFSEALDSNGRRRNPTRKFTNKVMSALLLAQEKARE